MRTIQLQCTEEPFLQVTLSKIQYYAVRDALREEALRLRTHDGKLWTKKDFCGPLGQATFSEGRINNYLDVAELIDCLEEVPFLSR